MKAALLVFLGGGLGSVCRYGVGLAFAERSASFPFGTLAANVLGCFLIGLLLSIVGKQAWFSQDAQLLLTTGFCGGFTTFSTFAHENVSLMGAHRPTMVLLYAGLSVALGFSAAYAGMQAAKLL